MSARRIITAAIALGVVAAITVIVTGSPRATDLGTTRITNYRITYRVTFENSVRYEDLSVRRPYEAADLTAADASAVPSTGAISTESALYDVRGPGDLVLVGGREPGPPSGDQDLATQMPEILARHLASDLHTSQRIAGRTCHTFRFVEPPSGPIKPLKGSDHDDVCIASGGLVLSESWTLKGNAAFSRRATKVSHDALPIPEVANATTPTGQGGATARVVTNPSTFIEAPSAPSGWHARPVVELAIPAPNAPGSPALASIVWAFSHGSRTMFVEAGGPSGQVPWQSGDTVTRSVRLAHLGKATTAIRSDGAEIRVALSGGRWVRIRGTLPLRTLLRDADRLRLR
jgi:hypothetical protein